MPLLPQLALPAFSAAFALSSQRAPKSFQAAAQVSPSKVAHFCQGLFGFGLIRVEKRRAAADSVANVFFYFIWSARFRHGGRPPTANRIPLCQSRRQRLDA